MACLILSLDGGGIRGVMTAKLLERLEDEKPFLNEVELVAGTSTGGILALGIAAGFAPAQLVQLYVENGEEIFSPRDLWDVIAGPADELVRADYDYEYGDGNGKGLKRILEKKLGTRTLRDLDKKVLIPTFDLDNQATPPNMRQWKPKFLHNYEIEGSESDGDVLAVDAAVRTSVAPTYFPSYQGYIDGGVVASNPSACALAQVIRVGHHLDDTWLLSVGTGVNPHVIRGDRLDWGKVKWLTKIIDLMLDGMPAVADYQCARLLGPRYHRLDIPLEQIISGDDVARIDTLLSKATDCKLEATLEWLDRALRGL